MTWTAGMEMLDKGDQKLAGAEVRISDLLTGMYGDLETPRQGE